MRPTFPHETATTPREPTLGFAYALSAFLLWGLFPFYLKAVSHIPVWEVVSHRIVWSVPVALVLVLVMRRTADLRAALRDPKTLALAALTATLISVNWGVYVYAVGSGQAVQGALGYYINPLINVLLGAVLLGERLERLQMLAVGLAIVAVAILTVMAGGLPWISLVLAGSFGFYGFFRKTLPVGPVQGFTLEVLILSLVALPFLLWLAVNGTGTFGKSGSVDMWLLLVGGPVTAIPLVLYASGAKLLRYTTIGVMQYLSPTMIFLIAVFAFDEPFSKWQLIAFCFIWAALAVYSYSLFGKARRKPRLSQET
ncbi:MAG: EamA family transporter RarD [Ahrensia sp.]